MARSILAIVIGYLVFAGSAVALFQLAGVEPHAPTSGRFFLFGVAYGVFFALLAGYVTAWIARRRVLWPVLVLAAIVAIVAALSLLLARDQAAWSELAALILMAPAVVVGGAIRLRNQR